MPINTDPSSRLANFRFAGVPADATPFNAANGTDISDTTAQAIKAAVTGKRQSMTRTARGGFGVCAGARRAGKRCRGG